MKYFPEGKRKLQTLDSLSVPFHNSTMKFLVLCAGMFYFLFCCLGNFQNVQATSLSYFNLLVVRSSLQSFQCYLMPTQVLELRALFLLSATDRLYICAGTKRRHTAIKGISCGRELTLLQGR